MTPASSDQPRGPAFWSAFVIGWVVIGFGVLTVLQRAGATHPVMFAAWFLGLIFVHDLLLSPAASVAARWIGGRIPRWGVAVVLGGAIVSGTLVLISLPPFLGESAGNETLLPRNYVGGLAGALAVTWVVVLAVVLVRRRSRGSA